MSTLKIGDKEYDINTLNDEAKKHLAALQIAENEINQLRARLGMIETARGVYLQMLMNAVNDPLSSDTIKLS